MNIQGPVPQASSIPQRLEAAARAAAARPRAAGAQAPSGTTEAESPEATNESSLWEILTAEEREFFEAQASMGPLTYKPSSPRKSQGAAPTGQRIDVKG